MNVRNCINSVFNIELLKHSILCILILLKFIYAYAIVFYFVHQITTMVDV